MGDDAYDKIGDPAYAEEVRLLARIEALEEENQRLREENFSLAANQCHAGYAGEHGHHRCRYQDQLAAVEESYD